MRSLQLRTIGTACLAGLACTAGSACRDAADDGPPNVLLVSIDTLRPDHLSCYGYGRATSPRLDRLAAEGVLFEEHVSSSSWTLPAHAALFTSLPDSLHRCTDTDKALAEEAETLAERFRASGYATAGFFSGPYLHPAFGLAQGFEHYQDCTSYAERIAGAPERWAMDAEVMRASHADVTSPRLVAAFEQWLERRDDGPFFAFVHMWDPHFDFVPPPPWDTKFDPGYDGPVDGRGFFFDDARYKASMPERDLAHLLALYDGEIGYTDEHLGRLLDELERRGLLDRTIVCVTSDHGTEFFEHGHRGHRTTLYEEVVRVPLVLRFPAGLPAGKRVASASRSINVAPTLLDLAGLPLLAATYGQSLVPRTQGAPGSIPPALCELDSVGRRLRALRSPECKLFDDLGAGDRYWYDLQRDPRERTKLVDDRTPLFMTTAKSYDQELDRIAQHRSRHPLPAAVPHALPPELLRQLQGYGYVGEEEER